MTATAWWQTFFDVDYLRLWEGFITAERTEQEAAGLVAVLGLEAGARVLDAPCGYGRIARALAVRGMHVVGVDLSETLLAEAERRRGDVPETHLRYHRHDLRQPLDERGFDAAVNVFSSIGYGTEADDLAMLSNLRDAVRPGGLVFVETMHRDRVVAHLQQNQRPASRLPDGTLLVEEPRLDPIKGRIETTWYWAGPGGTGEKRASLRIYTATELVALCVAAGLRFRAACAGCSAAPFVEPGAAVGGRLGLLAERV